MPTIRTIGIRIALLICVASGQLFADPPDPVQEDVLRPAERRPAYGAILGGNAVFSSGTLYTTCDCEYKSGNGFGFAAGGFFELPVFDQFGIVGQLSYDGIGATYSDLEQRLEYVDNGDFIFLDFDKEADVSLSYLNIDALLKWNIGNRALYLLIGPSVGYLVSGRISETEDITTAGYTYMNTGSNRKVYIDDESLDELYDVQQFRIALRFGLGYEIPVTNTMQIVPELSYSLPFTTIVKGFKQPVADGSYDVTDWKHSSLQLAVRFMYWL